MGTIEYTADIVELQNARAAMQDAIKLKKSEINRKHRTLAALELAEEIQEAEIRFAKKLKEANDSGVPQSLLRSEVLRTNTWSVWEKWRDLANIEPARVLVQRAKKLVGKFWRWDEDFKTLWLVKSVDGKTELPTPIPVINWRVDKDGEFEAYFTRPEMPDDEKRVLGQMVKQYFGPLMGNFFGHVEPIIRAAEQEGNTTVPDLRTE